MTAGPEPGGNSHRSLGGVAVTWLLSFRCRTLAAVDRAARAFSFWAKAVTLGSGADRLLRASGWILCKHSTVLAAPPPIS